MRPYSVLDRFWIFQVKSEERSAALFWMLAYDMSGHLLLSFHMRSGVFCGIVDRFCHMCNFIMVLKNRSRILKYDNSE